jgi:hypothetical protein
MKTLKQIKEEIAKEYLFDSYLEMVDSEDGFDIYIIDEIAKRYAKEQLTLTDVSQQGELLAFEEWCKDNTTKSLRDGIKLAIENYSKANCG